MTTIICKMEKIYAVACCFHILDFNSTEDTEIYHSVNIYGRI